MCLLRHPAVLESRTDICYLWITAPVPPSPPPPRFVPVRIDCQLIQVTYTNFTTGACQKACLVQQLFFHVHSYTSTALTPSRYSLVHCREYTNDCIPTTKSVPAPSALAKITRKRGQQAIYLKGQARLSKCSTTIISVAGILTVPGSNLNVEHLQYCTWQVSSHGTTAAG